MNWVHLTDWQSKLKPGDRLIWMKRSKGWGRSPVRVDVKVVRVNGTRVAVIAEGREPTLRQVKPESLLWKEGA